MIFDAFEFYKDYAVRYVTEGNKHCQEGWIQTECPFCTGNPGWHLGYSLYGGFYTCWRCGWHPIIEVVKIFVGTDWQKAKEIIKQYESLSSGFSNRKKSKKIVQKLQLPFGSDSLKKLHKKYLRSREFDSNKISEIWDLKGTGPIGDYKRRIIAPIFYNGFLVSYQGRAYNNNASLRYKACKQSDEVIYHKEVLYGLDLVEGYDCILVEGITDVWRIGPGAVGSFGIKMKPKQILLLAERFQKVFIMFDDDPQAVKAAKQIGYDLSMLGIKTERCIIKGDPAALSQKKADLYKRQLLGKY